MLARSSQYCVNYSVGTEGESKARIEGVEAKFNVTTSEPIPMSAGIPQGSPLSSLLYIYYNADLLDITSEKIDTMSLEFIDDIVYRVQSESDTENICKIKRLLEKAEE